MTRGKPMKRRPLGILSSWELCPCDEEGCKRQPMKMTTKRHLPTKRNLKRRQQLKRGLHAA